MHQHFPALNDIHIVVRPAVPRDLDETASIGSTFSEFRHYVPDDLSKRFSQEDRAVVVAERDGQIAGTVTFDNDASRTGLDVPQEWSGFRTLAAHPAARRLGDRGLPTRVFQGASCWRNTSRQRLPSISRRS